METSAYQDDVQVDHERGRNHGSGKNHGTLQTKGKNFEFISLRFSAHDQKRTRDNQGEIIEKDREFKRTENIGDEAEKASKNQHIKTLYGLTKMLCKERSRRSTTVLDKNGNLISSKSEVTARWTYLQITGGPSHPEPEISGGPGLKNYFLLLGPYFGLKIRGEAGPLVLVYNFKRDNSVTEVRFI